MTQKLGLTKGAFLAGMCDASDEVQIMVNGQPATGVSLSRNTAGTLEINLEAPVAVVSSAQEIAEEPAPETPALEQTDAIDLGTAGAGTTAPGPLQDESAGHDDQVL